MTNLKNNLLILSVCVFAACATATVALPSQADVERGKTYYPSLTLEELNQGKTNYDQQCNKCHDYASPTSKSAEQWKKIIPKMAGIVKKKTGKDVLDATMQESIQKYVITMSNATR